MTRLRALAILAALVVGVLVDVVVHADIPGYGVGIGLVGALLLTFGSQALAKAIKRPADYYEHLDTPRPREAGDE